MWVQQMWLWQLEKYIYALFYKIYHEIYVRYLFKNSQILKARWTHVRAHLLVQIWQNIKPKLCCWEERSEHEAENQIELKRNQN